MTDDLMKSGPSEAAMDGRRPWSTPTVIVSDIAQSGAGVTFATDGTSTGGYQYGS
ncbi:hypothetical protein [Sphingomonas qomolangmaensis]|uniref:Uncharacterized protein n=1 Tax=Sphingomonas qomolangmaensis TaxID=2918765 RepID=A0ABY5L665_9SPHN|nr:hypothetical protein [Sphingomonas qomolangmaensis]UUL82453.1 hypothetical protein NMP03_14990 [Sphingomonas qomolangmaensis]